MIDFENSKTDALNSLRLTNSVKILSIEDKKKQVLPAEFEVWEIDTEISINGIGENVTLLIVFYEDNFPIELPKILLSPKSYRRFEYYPHIQPDRVICAFSDSCQLDTNRPADILQELLARAKSILEDGISQKNATDYDDELSAYWDRNYHKNDKTLSPAVIITDDALQDIFYIIILDQKLNDIRFIIHQNDGEAIRFKSFLESYNAKYTETEGMYIGAVDFIIKPPFDLTNKNTFDRIKKFDENIFLRLQSFLNKKNNPKVILFSKNIKAQLKYFGWIYNNAILHRQGFRPGSFSNFSALSTFQSQEFVQRLNTEKLTIKRLSQRSAGIQANSRYIFGVIGIGSIGSHIIPMLNTLSAPEFRLVDPETLSIENIGRHFLGFSEVNKYKTEAIKKFLQFKRPTQAIETREKSVFEVIGTELSFLNEANFLFVAIGQTTTEMWFASLIKENIVKVPTFFIWVEPYLAGGHCIYSTPNDAKFQEYFDENGFFKFNIIHHEDYKNKSHLLSLREAGCQTEYIPYSSANAVQFLGCLFPRLIRLIQGNDFESRSFTWIGDKAIINDLGIQISTFGSLNQYGSVIENKL